MSIYIRCGHCGTMKPQDDDPDEQLAGIRDALLWRGAPPEDERGAPRTVADMFNAFVQYNDWVFDRMRAAEAENAAIRAALPDGYVLAERTRVIAGDGGSDAPKQTGLGLE